MAYLTDSASSRPLTSVSLSLFSAISGFFSGISNAQDRSYAVQRLQSLSDRQLADMGIARKDIVRHVDRDLYDV